MSSLPPDLDRLGEQLARAAGHTLAVRRLRGERRRRIALAAVIGAVMFGALTPAELGRSVRSLGATPLVAAALPRACDHLHGAGFVPERCMAAEAAVSHRPYAWR